jgi:uncharacterized protein YkwD
VAITRPFPPAGALFARLLAAMTAVLAVFMPSVAHADATSASTDHVERDIISKLNRIRSRDGLPHLHSNRALARAADYHCADMLRADFFAHSSSNGQSMESRVESYRESEWVGETLAYVPKRGAGHQAARIVRMWMHSPPHRAALLDGRFSRIGVARRVGQLDGQRSIVFTADLASRH